VVFASQDSLPDNILYPIKVKVLEPMEGALAFSNTAKAKHESGLATKRLIEAETLAKAGKLNSSNEEKINNLLTLHTISLNKALEKVDDTNATETIEDISTSFRAEMNAHAKVLAVIKEKQKQKKSNDNEVEKEDNKISNTAKVNAEKIKKISNKINKENIVKYNSKKEEVKSLIENTDEKVKYTNQNENKIEISTEDDTHKTIDKAREYLEDSTMKDKEGDWKEAYSSLLDSESSIKEANILFKNGIKHKEERKNKRD